MTDSATATGLHLPNLVMVGLGKSGTTSLFYYLSQHPDICPSDVKEIRYFRPKGNGYVGGTSIERYAAHFVAWSGERYRLEASPQYLHGGEPMITAMRETLGDPRIIITLRNPVDRMWSTYRSAKARRFLPADLSFEQYVERCRRVYESGPAGEDDRAYRTMTGGFYASYVRLWLDAFAADSTVVFFERMVSDPAGVVGEVCDWLDVDTGCVGGFDYGTQNETRQSRNFLAHRIAVAANSERLLRRHRRLKAPLRRAYYAVNGSRSVERMPTDLRVELGHVFAPGNAELRTELAARGYTRFPAWLDG